MRISVFLFLKVGGVFFILVYKIFEIVICVLER